MQTFLPYQKFNQSARVLDDRRLGKQRVETMQIMHALVRLQVRNDIRGGVIPWSRHPATLMWRGFEGSLMNYQQAVCAEWRRRGFADTTLQKTQEFYDRLADIQEVHSKAPWWLGLKRFHSVHRANLLRKDPDHYGQWGWKEEPAEGYWWPVV